MLSAMPFSGYSFIGWFDANGTKVHDYPEYTTTVAASGAQYSYTAKFDMDTVAVFEWEGTTQNKLLTWKSKRFSTEVPFNPNGARLLADGYDEFTSKLTVAMSSKH